MEPPKANKGKGYPVQCSGRHLLDYHIDVYCLLADEFRSPAFYSFPGLWIRSCGSINGMVFREVGAGQYKFGGRSGGCVALLGLAKLVLGLVFWSSLVRVLDQFPVGVLGVLMLFAGIELAICSRNMNSKEESFVMLVCTTVSLVGSRAALGFACGIVVHLFLG
ncbi:hypothetical protein LguiA_033258 [Lonicera macranthoides]